MRKKLPIGISDFKELIDNKRYYVDKSLLIQEVIEKGTKVALIPRLRRFGKTLNLSMLQYFFEKSEEDRSYLFKGLKIWEKEKYRAVQGKFPVVFLTLKDIKYSTWDEAFDAFRGFIAKEFQRHRYLMEGEILAPEEKEDYLKIIRKEGSQVAFASSLTNLTEWMYRYHKTKIIVLIDEYDAPAHAAYMGGYYEIMIEFLRNWLSGGLKDNVYLERGIVTGILRIAKESIFSGLNNISTFTILDEQFQDKFGLVESEVIELLREYHLESRLAEVKKWYDGYRIGSYEGIYNPWSVLNFVEKNGVIGSYWVNSSDNALMKRLITKGGGRLKADVEELLRDGSIEKKIEEGIIFPELDKGTSTIWALLLYSGYLTIKATPAHGVPCRLCIPNREVKELFQSLVIEWFDKSIDSDNYRLLLESLITGDIDTFSRAFQHFVISSFSIFDIPFNESEKIYHAFVLGMLVGLKGKYDIKSNRESGFGKYDVMVIPKDPKKLGIIMEFKKVEPSEANGLEKAAKLAIEQIEDKKYAQELFDRGITHILYLGLAFSGKKVVIDHKFKE